MTTAAMWQRGSGPISPTQNSIKKWRRKAKMKWHSIKPGKRVWWTDPDNKSCSGWGIIIKAQEPVQPDSVITLKMDHGSCVEALPQELSQSNDDACESCGGKGWLFSIIKSDGSPHNQIERCDACELYENDQAAVEAVVEMARSHPQLLRLVKEISDLTHKAE